MTGKTIVFRRGSTIPVHNAGIAELFNRLAGLLEIEGDHPFRIRAYRNAARIIAGLAQSVAGLLESGKALSELPGIGEAIAEKIQTIVETGRLSQLEEVEIRTSASLSDLMKIKGLAGDEPV